jgi:hypothetical protein
MLQYNVNEMHSKDCRGEQDFCIILHGLYSSFGLYSTSCKAYVGIGIMLCIGGRARGSFK